VTAIFDPKPGGIARAKSVAPGVFVTDSFDAFMAADINTIAVCSPDSTHSKYVVSAIKAGKYVVCEKPLADSLNGCLDVLKAQANAPHVVAAVQHQMRFVPVHTEMKRLIESGKLGRISYIEGFYVHNLTERAYRYDDWRLTDNATPLVYAGCHFVDLLRWLLNDEVEEIMGMANNIAFPGYPESDLNVVLLRFRSGIIGKVVVAFGAGRPQDHSVRLYGSNMSIENNLLFAKDGTYKVFARPHLPSEDRILNLGRYPWNSLNPRTHLRWLRNWLRNSRPLVLAKVSELVMSRVGVDPEYGILSYPIRLYPHQLAVRTSLQNFVNAVRGDEPLLCPLEEAAKTVATCLAGVQAYRSR